MMMMIYKRNNRTMITRLGRSMKIVNMMLDRHFGSMTKRKDGEIVKEKKKEKEKVDDDDDYDKRGRGNSGVNNTSILNMLSGEFNNIGKNIESAVHKQVNELERLNEHHNKNVIRLANKLAYIQDNIGLHNNDENNTRILANELIDMPVDKVIELVKDLTKHVDNKVSMNFRTEDELFILLSHLVFRNSLNADLFSRIVMKLGIFNLRQVHNKLVQDPEDFIMGWNDNGRSRIVCGLALTARYKMLKDFKSAQGMVRSEFQDIWMNALINNERLKVLNGGDIKNFINVIDGLIEYGYLVTCIIKTKNAGIVYSFWERHGNDGLIKEWLELESGDGLNKYQKFIIDMYTNASISTVNKWKLKVLNISKKLRLGIVNSEQVNKDKYFAFIELLLNEMEEEMEHDIERREYFKEIKGKFRELKGGNYDVVEGVINKASI